MRMKEEILRLAAAVPLFTTANVTRYFSGNGSPSKRASEALKKLEAEKLIEGRRREIGKTKLWRLTTTGREYLGINKLALPFTCQKVEHVLEIANIYQDLEASGRLLKFLYEPKDEFHAGRKMFYSPDAFFILRKKSGGAEFYLMEVQKVPLSATRWAAKWGIASAFFDGEFYKEASWQIEKERGKLFKPRILALSGQSPETIQAGTSLNITIARDIKDILQ